MELGSTLKIKGENFRLIKEYRDIFLAVSEIGIRFIRIPKFIRIK